MATTGDCNLAIDTVRRRGGSDPLRAALATPPEHPTLAITQRLGKGAVVRITVVGALVVPLPAQLGGCTPGVLGGEDDKVDDLRVGQASTRSKQLSPCLSKRLSHHLDGHVRVEIQVHASTTEPSELRRRVAALGNTN